jgi:hypothetical protein
LEKNQPAIVYFGEKGDKWNEAEKLLEKIADKVAGKLKVVMTEIKDGMGKRIAEYIGCKNEDLPSVRILDTRKDLSKYIMEGTIDEKTILDFVDGWEKGKLKKTFKNSRRTKRKQWRYFCRRWKNLPKRSN